MEFDSADIVVNSLCLKVCFRGVLKALKTTKAALWPRGEDAAPCDLLTPQP